MALENGTPLSNKAQDLLLEALRLAIAQPEEQRLFRGGKLPGLFATRTGDSADAAAHAIREGFLEVVRTESKGKVVNEWVRATPRAITYLHTHESPLAVLRELRDILASNRVGIPIWMERLQEDIRDHVQETLKRLASLEARVEDALKQATHGPVLPDRATTAVPWAYEAVTYLDQRAVNGAPGECPLPELFRAVCRAFPNLSLIEFQDGLRRLVDYRALRLVRFPGPIAELAEPEFAMPDGRDTLYYAARA
jgi:hypothetical protein